MSPIIANSMGDVRQSYNKPLADSQTIKKGDPVTVSAGKVSKAAIGATKIEGFATHDVTSTTGYTSDSQRPRLIYDLAEPKQDFKG